MAKNIELKARLPDPSAARTVAEAITTKRIGMQHQIDTYFRCRDGRLKLRQIDGLSAVLIWYCRADTPDPSCSDYELVPVANPETLKAALTAALGVCAVVEKRREIFFYHNVRIHLDEVVALGHFLEFEAVLGSESDEDAGRGQLAFLAEQFAVEPRNLLARSYGDMAAGST